MPTVAQRIVLVLTLGVALGGCVSSAGGISASSDGNPETSPTPRTSQNEPSCRRPWPHDAHDPQVGIYVYGERAGLNRSVHTPSFLFYDGRSVTRIRPLVSPRAIRGYSCTYGVNGEVGEYLESHHVYRLAAYTDDEGVLWALEPCFGWHEIGQFIGGYYEEGGGRLHKLPVGAMGELFPSGATQWERDVLFECRDVFRSEVRPVPERP